MKINHLNLTGSPAEQDNSSDNTVLPGTSCSTTPCLPLALVLSMAMLAYLMLVLLAAFIHTKAWQYCGAGDCSVLCTDLAMICRQCCSCSCRCSHVCQCAAEECHLVYRDCQYFCLAEIPELIRMCQPEKEEEKGCCQTPSCQTSCCQTPCCMTPFCQTPCCLTPCCQTPCCEPSYCQTSCCQTLCCQTSCCQTPCCQSPCSQTSWCQTPCCHTEYCSTGVCMNYSCLCTEPECGGKVDCCCLQLSVKRLGGENITGQDNKQVKSIL